MSYKSHYLVSPARQVAYLLDAPHQPCDDSLRAMSAQVTTGTWFGLVIGILLSRVLLEFGSTWDCLDFELIMGGPNTYVYIRV